ncbi:MAG: clan AA aspartic protease [Lentisphaerae bacterium]|jgi:clan AA aspartic protease (TIGR02281 family)|nr:clan AA aspartic protease [Lentisphaerota bacterium]MBT4817496.1 clan AA aspartic protease [Lentisphaerota bacterium]MBT5612990.1 clan AA aspartic protease [Lentisphaerota bacterium]MBT7059068.1 clan AA aspartic protease [Lentisphaerota bacterium]MBT7847090.1 clan AA aspartic protease [Lentisphaerota bacterium]
MNDHEKVRCWWAAALGALMLVCLPSPGGLLRLAGEAVVLTGKVATTAVKTTGAVVMTTGKITGATVSYFAGERTVELEREGNSFYVNVKINRKRKVRLLLDTGATDVQISPALAHKLKLDLRTAERVRCTLADGSVTTARVVTLKEVRLSRSVKAQNVQALVLEADRNSGKGGLLGMSFLNHFIFQIDTEAGKLRLRHRENE